jgi:hypothetical protein
MQRISRVVLAFAVAPIAATAAVMAILATIDGSHHPVGFYILVVSFAYGVNLVLGVPAFLFTRSWNVRAPVSCALVAVVLGLVPAAFLWFIFSSTLLSIATIAGAGVAGLVFGAVVYGT